MPGQCSVAPFAVAGWLTAAHNCRNSARTRVALCWVLLSSPARVGSTRCKTRCTVTEVAWSALAHPVAAAAAAGVAEDEALEDAGAEDAAWAADVPGADDVAPAPAGAEAVTEPHPASAEHSSTASTVPRTWRGDIIMLGRSAHVISSIDSAVPQSTPAAITAPTTMSSRHAISSLRSPAAAPIRAPSSRPASDMATLTTPNTTAARTIPAW